MMSKCKMFVVMGLVMGISPLYGQMAGNPIGSRGEGEWTVSAIGTYMDHRSLGSESAISKRFLLKSSWGLAPCMDVYCLAGGTQVTLKPRDARISDYEGKYRLGYGIGFNLTTSGRSPSAMKWVAGCQALRFASEGSFNENIRVGANTYVREFAMTYDWREIRMNVGMIIPLRSIRIYLAGAGWLVQRLDTKREFLSHGDARSFVGEEEGELRTGLWTGGIGGIEFLLGNQYAITVEALVFNEENYQFMVGICQTGGSRW
jgi:hypothetical protein